MDCARIYGQSANRSVPSTTVQVKNAAISQKLHFLNRTNMAARSVAHYDHIVYRDNRASYPNRAADQPADSGMRWQSTISLYLITEL